MSEYSNSATRQLLNQGGRFGRWIAASVGAFIDDLAGSAGDSRASRTLVMFGADGVEVYRRGKSGARELVARLEGRPEELAAGLRGALKGTRPSDLVLRIAAGRAVVKEVGLPVGALDVLPAVIRNKVESLAPWPLAEALWGYRVAGPPKAGQIGVSVGIISRRTLDGLAGALRNAGLKAGYLDIGRSAEDPDSIAIDFLSEGRYLRARRTVRLALSAVALVALTAAGYGGYLAYGSYARLAATQQRMDELRQALLQKSGTGATSLKLAEANKLYQRKLETRPVVAVLNDLTRLIPDGTWLHSFDLDGATLTIAGTGTGIPAVIEALEKSEVFSGVNFAAATQRDAAHNADAFAISAIVEPKVAKP